MTSDNDDPGERGRVYSRIAPLIMGFARAHSGQSFHMEDLRQYVQALDPGIAPDSPGRILRLLRQEGKLYYVVIDRRASLYQFRTLRAAA